MARRLQEARLQGAAEIKEGNFFDAGAADAAYAAAFQEYGLDVDGLDPQAAAEQIRARAIHRQLVAALDDWARTRRALKAEGWKQRLAVTRAVDPDTWRNRLRDVLEAKDRKTLEEVVAAAPAGDWPVRSLELLGTLARGTASGERLAALLGQAQQRHPNDFWINHTLGRIHHYSRPPRLEEALRYYSIAVALRPESPIARFNLGSTLKDKGRLDEAIAAYREAIRLKNDYAEVHDMLGLALADKGRLEEAMAEHREALRLKKDYPEAHNNLGIALLGKGQVEEAIAELQEALRLKRDHPEAHSNLGSALRAKGQLDEAIAEYRKAVHLNKDQAEFHGNLGIALAEKGQFEEAVAELRKATDLKPELAEAHNNLGAALREQGKLVEAEAECRKAIALKPELADAHNNLGNALCDQEKLVEAEAACREALRLKKDYPEAHTNLGIALCQQGKLVEAEAACRKAIAVKPELASAHTHLGSALYQQGKVVEAEAECRKAIKLNPDFAHAHNILGAILIDAGLKDQANAEFRKAIKLKNHEPSYRFNLGRALIRNNQLDEGIAQYREALNLREAFAGAHCNLGLALKRKGQLREAVKHLRRGHALGSSDPTKWPYPSARWLSEAEQMAQLDERLPAVLHGKAEPKDAGERIGFAKLCQLHRKRYAAAARFYAEAFVAQPALAEDLRTGNRYDAAWAAALAGCGQGKDAGKLDTKERAGLRKQALDWLRADLKAYRQAMDKSADKAGPEIAQRMQDWLQDTDFTGVRGPEALRRLPEAERGEWQKLWEEVTALRQRAAKPAQPASRARP